MDTTTEAQPETATIVHTLPKDASELLAAAALHGWTGSVSLERTRLPGTNMIGEALRVEVADPGRVRVLWQEYTSTLPDARLAVTGSRLPGSEYCFTPLTTAGQVRFIADNSALDD